jgi:hypothetical protein
MSILYEYSPDQVLLSVKTLHLPQQSSRFPEVLVSGRGSMHEWHSASCPSPGDLQGGQAATVRMKQPCYKAGHKAHPPKGAHPKRGASPAQAELHV